jgi:hypothetical protein
MSRQISKNGIKKKKIDLAYMENGRTVYDFLNVKQQMIDNNIFGQIIAAAALLRYNRIKKNARKRRLQILNCVITNR